MRGTTFFRCLTCAWMACGWLIAQAAWAGEAVDYPPENGVMVLNMEGKPVEFFPTDGPPNDVTVLPATDAFVVANGDGLLRIYQGNGQVVFQKGFAPLNDVDVLDSPDRFLLTSRSSRKVWVYDRRTNQEESIPYTFVGPTDADGLPNGHWLVCDAAAGRVVELSSRGEVVWSYQEGLAQPMDAIRLPEGDTLISDFDHHRIIRVNAEGQVTFELGGFNHPIKMSEVAPGRYLVADGDHQRLVEFTLGGEMREIRGRLNYIQSASFFPQREIYLCAIHNRFQDPNRTAAAAASAPASPASRASGFEKWIFSRYACLGIAVLAAVLTRGFAPGSEIAQAGFVISWILVMGVAYGSITEAAARAPYVPGVAFGLCVLFVWVRLHRDAKEAFLPPNTWQAAQRNLALPFTPVYLLVLLAWSLVPLTLQYVHVKKAENVHWAWIIITWGIGMVLLFRPFLRRESSRALERREVQWGRLRLAVPFTTGSVSVEDEDHEREGERWIESPYPRAWANTTVLIVMALAAVLYLAGATSVPTDVHGDEAEVALHGIEVRDSGNWNGFNLGWYLIPQFFFLIPAWVMGLFGDNLFGMRMTGALIGVGTIPVFYLLARRVLLPVPATLAVFFFATSSYFVHFSRMGTGYTQATLITVAGLYFLLRGLQEEDDQSYLLAGVMAGIGFLSYQATHILAPLAVMTPAAPWLTRRISIHHALKAGFLVALALWVTISPLGGNALRDPSAFTSRAEAVSLFSAEGRRMIHRDYPPTYTMKQILPLQLLRTALAPITQPDSSPYLVNLQYGGMLDPLPALFFTAGLVHVLSRFMTLPCGLLLGWFLLLLFPGSVFTNTAPAYQRLTVVFPLLALMAAPMAHAQFVQLQRAFRLSLPAREYVMATGLGVMLLLGVHRYFHQIMATPQLLDDSTRVAHYLHEQGSTVYTYFFGKPYFSIEYGNIRFLASEAQGMDVSNPEPFLQSPVTRRGPVIFLLLGKNREYLPRLRELYPGGREEHHYNRLHQSPFITYEVNL